MSNPFKTKEFKVLLVQWNEILEATGLKDIEDFSLKEPPLKDWHGSNWAHLSFEEKLEVQTYYHQASDLLRTYKFKCMTHKRIWRLHCIGMSGRRIALRIDRQFYRKSVIYQIIAFIEKDSGLKSG